MQADICHLNLARGFRSSERQTELLVKALAAYQIPQMVIARKGQLLAQQCRNVEYVEVHEATDPATALRFARNSRLVHAHEARSGYTGLAAKWFFRIPYIVTYGTTQHPKNHPFTRAMYRGASEVIVLSHAISQTMQEYDNTLSVVHIPNAVSGYKYDPNYSAKLRERWNAEFVIGQIGAIDFSSKGQELTLAVARRWASTSPRVHFVFWGTGKDELRLREISSGMPNIHVVGQTSNVGDYLSSFDVLVMPSREEGSAPILLDALAFGVPVVATKVGGIVDAVVDGKTGILFDVGDIEAFDNALRALYQVPAKRQALSHNGRQIAPEYAPEKIAARYLEVYRTVIDVHPMG